MTDISRTTASELLRTLNLDTFIGADLKGISLGFSNLEGLDLTGANLEHSDIGNVNFNKACFRNTRCYRASFSDMDFAGATFDGAQLVGAELIDFRAAHSSMVGANLNGADLYNSSIIGANLTDVDFTFARLAYTDTTDTILTNMLLDDTIIMFCDTLHKAIGLETIEHLGPSSIDQYTLVHCIHGLPDVFLEGCGYSRLEIETLRALYIESPIRYFSCFISHAEPDLSFANRLLADLRHNNVTCWHYKDQMRGGSH